CPASIENETSLTAWIAPKCLEILVSSRTGTSFLASRNCRAAARRTGFIRLLLRPPTPPGERQDTLMQNLAAASILPRDRARTLAKIYATGQIDIDEREARILAKDGSRSMLILVTGATGKVGRHFIEGLLDDQRFCKA